MAGKKERRQSSSVKAVRQPLQGSTPAKKNGSKKGLLIKSPLLCRHVPRLQAHRVFASQGVGGYNAVSRRLVLVHLRAREGAAFLVCSQAGVPRCRLDGAAAAAVAGHPPARGRR